MNNIFCVTSYNSVGCTFIDWSVYFLSGQLQHYNVKLDQWLPVSQNPLIALNAHGHAKNHPSGLVATKNFIEQLGQLSPDTLHSIYPGPLVPTIVAEHLKIPIDKISDARTFDFIKQYRKNDYNEIFKLCGEKKLKIVFVSSDPGTILYFNQKRVIPRLVNHYNKHAVDVEQARDIFHQVFFNQNQEQWKDLVNTWDKREQMALNSRPFDQALIAFDPDSTYPYLWVNSIDLWTRTSEVIKKIMNYLGVPIDNKRFEQWLPVCLSWQKIHLDILDFCFNQDHIVKSIVNNWDCKIDLTFDQEVIIQHCLIYHYGLNLKTWQLKKFPANTKDLHKLLEPNIHSVTDIYSRLTT